MKLRNLALVEQYRQILTNSLGTEIIEVDINIACRAAELRAKYSLKTPDAIQLATALENNAHFFLTNDLRLKKLKEKRVITPKDL